jgi:hypothetical protein
MYCFCTIRFGPSVYEWLPITLEYAPSRWSSPHWPANYVQDCTSFEMGLGYKEGDVAKPSSNLLGQPCSRAKACIPGDAAAVAVTETPEPFVPSDAGETDCPAVRCIEGRANQGTQAQGRRSKEEGPRGKRAGGSPTLGSPTLAPCHRTVPSYALSLVITPGGLFRCSFPRTNHEYRTTTVAAGGRPRFRPPQKTAQNRQLEPL